MENIFEKELDELEAIITKIDVDQQEEVIKAAWELSHREDLSQEVRSLATDTALVAGGDYSGEYSSKFELMGALKQLKKDN